MARISMNEDKSSYRRSSLIILTQPRARIRAHRIAKPLAHQRLARYRYACRRIKRRERINTARVTRIM